MKITKLSDVSIREAVRVLDGGGLVIFPSDTVYGALVDARNSLAVSRLISFKARPPGKPISVFVSGEGMMYELVKAGEQKKQIVGRLAPGPFTFILDSKHQVDVALESEKGTLGVRVPDYKPVIELVNAFEGPLTATSANLSGRRPHYSIEAMLREFPKAKQSMIDLVVDAGKLPMNKPSTIIDLTSEKLKVLRKGDISFNDFKTHVSSSPFETQKIADSIVRERAKNVSGKPLIVILVGEMGAGKTIFVKGAGKIFGLNNIISPTYVVYYEYKVKALGFNTFIHCDLFNIEEESEFDNLGLSSYMKPGTILFVEWGEKIGRMGHILKQKAEVVFIQMRYLDEKKRELTVQT